MATPKIIPQEIDDDFGYERTEDVELPDEEDIEDN